MLLSASYLHRWGLFCPSGRAPGHRGSQDANSFPKPDWYLEKERDSTEISCQHGLFLIIIIVTIYPPPDLHLISPDLRCPSCLSKAWAHTGRETCWRLGAPVLPCLYLIIFILFKKIIFSFPVETPPPTPAANQWVHLRPLLRRPAVVSRPRRTWFPLCNNIRSCFQSFQRTSKPFESSSILFYGFVWRVFAHQVISVKNQGKLSGSEQGHDGREQDESVFQQQPLSTSLAGIFSPRSRNKSMCIAVHTCAAVLDWFSFWSGKLSIFQPEIWTAESLPGACWSHQW